MIHLETPRLLLRDWKEEDIAPFAAMNSDPIVMRHFPAPLTDEQTLAFYRRITDELAIRGYGLYAVQRKDDAAFLGYVGFHHFDFDVDFAPGIEIGWRLRADCWNRGYATEAASACLEYARRRLPFREVYSFTALCNHPSERVMQKIGMQRLREFAHPSLSDGHPLQMHMLYHRAW